MNDMLREELRVISELQAQLGKMLANDETGKVKSELKKFVTKRPCWTAQPFSDRNPYLRCISEGQEIMIGETKGKRTIAKAKDVFPGWIDPDFVNYGLDVKGKAKPKIPAMVLEMEKNGTFKDVFGGFGENLDRLVLEQDQVIKFCEEHADWLRTDGYGTFFLLKEEDEFFVAFVYRLGGGLRVYADRLSGGRVWDAQFRRRFVVPQLDL